MGWMPHAEGLCWGRRAPANRHLLPVCQGTLLGWVLPLANEELTPDIISWEELKLKEGCQEELPARSATPYPAWKKRRIGAPTTIRGGMWGAGVPLCLPPSPRTPQRILLPSKTLATETGAVPTGEEDLLGFVFTVGEICLDISIPLGGPEFSRTHCLGLG